jgi:hypothetical protein
MPSSASAEIEIGGIFAWIRPADAASLVLLALGYTRTTFAANCSGGFIKKQRRETFYAWEQDGSLRILAGHVGRVKDLLERAGLAVTIRDHRRFRAQATPNLSLVAAAQGYRQRFLETIVREPRGLLEVSKQAHVLGLTAEICRLFPEARIYIPVGTRKQVARTRRKLQGILRAPVYVAEDYPWPWEGGRLVCSLQTFDRHNADDLEVVVCPEASKATVPAHVKSFGTLSQQRLYGFVRDGQTFSTQERLRLEGLFGPIMYRTHDPRGPKATVQVRWCVPPTSYRAGEPTALVKKRGSWWHNDRRNDLIARLAGALRAGDQEALWQCGLFLAEDEDVLLTAHRRNVAILVESVEHGLELCRRLPGWRLWSAVPKVPQPGNQSADARSNGGISVLDRVILALVQASRLESVNTDVLIVASGQGWPDALPGFPPRSWCRDHPVVLVDLADDFDTDARQATLRRRRAYAGRGWHELNTPTWMRQVP